MDAACTLKNKEKENHDELRNNGSYCRIN